MKRVMNSPVKQGAIGQCIVQAARPKSCLMPMLLGVVVDNDSYCVQNLHIKLSRMGFCLTVEEVRRYRQYIMQSAGPDDADAQSECTLTTSSESGHDEPVIHFLADNVDHNVC